MAARTTTSFSQLFRPNQSYDWIWGLIGNQPVGIQVVGAGVKNSRGTGFPEMHRFLEKARRTMGTSHAILTDDMYHAIAGMDFGSEFDVTRNSYSDNSNIIHLNNGRAKSSSWYRDYTGPLFAKSHFVSPVSTLWPKISALDEALLVTMGTAAVSATIPTNPVGNLVVALGEAASDFPKLIGSSLVKRGAGDPRAYGDEFLNYQFGVVPTVSDIRRNAKAVSGASKILNQYIRDSRRQIRRRFQFPDVVTRTVTTEAGQIQPPLDNQTLYDPLGVCTKVRTERISTWFSAAYIYHLNEDKSLLGRLARHEQLANRVLGTRFDLNTLYKLTPWSWLVDWVVNVGDVTHNLSAFLEDGLVMQRGYIMQTHEVVDTYTLTGVSPVNGSPITLEQSFGTIRKVRRRASPFGFGLTPGMFTARQWAILAALGISRDRQVARM